jgi:uncharacterized protein YegJ (DUF2314 family)
MDAPYPYPELDKDGYEFELVEQEDAVAHPFLRHPIPTDEKRNAVKSGDLVKLIFRFRDYVEKDGHTFTAEHMWVNVLGRGSGYFIGKLDNDPLHLTILKAGDEVHFHPKHIVKFWENSESNQ